MPGASEALRLPSRPPAFPTPAVVTAFAQPTEHYKTAEEGVCAGPTWQAQRL